MIVTDKQSLKRCVRQAVRHAPLAESFAAFDPMSVSLGVESLEHFCSLRDEGATPLHRDAAAGYAALEALALPTEDLQEAAQRQREYTREAWLREILDVGQFERVCVRLPASRAETALEDDRFVPMITVDDRFFPSGRLEGGWRNALDDLRAACALSGAVHAALEGWHERCLERCLFPLAQERRVILHVEAAKERQVAWLSHALEEWSGVRLVVDLAPEASYGCGQALIREASKTPRLLPCFGENASLTLIRQAIDVLGLRFMPYASHAALPELMLGRWILARERIWPLLTEAYLPLARSGVLLSGERIERDVRRFFAGNLLRWEPAENENTSNQEEENP